MRTKQGLFLRWLLAGLCAVFAGCSLFATPGVPSSSGGGANSALPSPGHVVTASYEESVEEEDKDDTSLSVEDFYPANVGQTVKNIY